MDIHFLPTINACLNASCSVTLLLGWKAIKQGQKELHRRFMITALILSAAFLASYLLYHYLSPGVTRYQGQGVIRIVYFSILLTHTPLAALIVPFCVAAVYQALKGDFSAHKKITRWLLPVWLYVSFTGVLIYLMLYILVPVSFTWVNSVY